jgi:hypothetical protein
MIANNVVLFTPVVTTYNIADSYKQCGEQNIFQFHSQQAYNFWLYTAWRHMHILICTLSMYNSIKPTTQEVPCIFSVNDHFWRTNCSINSFWSSSVLSNDSYWRLYLNIIINYFHIHKLLESPRLMKTWCHYQWHMCCTIRQKYLSSWTFFSAIKACSCCCSVSLCFSTDFNKFLDPIACQEISLLLLWLPPQIQNAE